MKDNNSNKNPRQNPDSNVPVWHHYIGKEVVLNLGNSVVLGVLREPNLEEGYLPFLPVIVYGADDEHVHLENEAPVSVSLSLLEKGKDYIIRPLGEGYLEERVKHVNASADRKQNKAGFSA